jgi:hypothetical protein
VTSVQFGSIARNAHWLEVAEVFGSPARNCHPMVNLPCTSGPISVCVHAVVRSGQLLPTACAPAAPTIEDVVKPVLRIRCHPTPTCNPEDEPSGDAGPFTYEPPQELGENGRIGTSPFGSRLRHRAGQVVEPRRQDAYLYATPWIARGRAADATGYDYGVGGLMGGACPATNRDERSSECR